MPITRRSDRRAFGECECEEEIAVKESTEESSSLAPRLDSVQQNHGVAIDLTLTSKLRVHRVHTNSANENK